MLLPRLGVRSFGRFALGRQAAGRGRDSCPLRLGEFNQQRVLKLYAELTPTGMFWIGLSCVVGVCISWAGFWCQSLITATAYTVVGVMNKMLTVLSAEPHRLE